MGIFIIYISGLNWSVNLSFAIKLFKQNPRDFFFFVWIRIKILCIWSENKFWKSVMLVVLVQRMTHYWNFRFKLGASQQLINMFGSWPQNGKAQDVHILTCLFHRTWIVTDVLCGLWSRGKNKKSKSPLEKSEWPLCEFSGKLTLALLSKQVNPDVLS